MKKLFGVLAFFVFAGCAHGQVVAQTASIALTWGASSTTGASYNVYREASAGACTPAAVAPACTRLNSTPLSVLTYTDTPTIGSQYFYVVRAVNSIGLESVNTNEVSMNLTTPGAPGVLNCNFTIVNGAATGSCK